MKKYQQLVIVSLGLLSFVSFLIYKHEYDRLRNVLEILEVFGSPPPNKSLQFQAQDRDPHLLDHIETDGQPQPQRGDQQADIKSSREVVDQNPNPLDQPHSNPNPKMKKIVSHHSDIFSHNILNDKSESIPVAVGP